MQDEGTQALSCVATIAAPAGRPCCFARATKSPLAQSTGQPGEGSQKGGELLRSSDRKSSVSLCRSGLTLAKHKTPRCSPATDRTYARGRGHTAGHMLSPQPWPPPHSSFTIA